MPRKTIKCPKGCPLQKAGYPALVTIPLIDYQALLKARLDLEQSCISFKQLSKPRRSTIERDPEVAVFISMKLGHFTVREIEKAVRREFGGSRTPSRQAIYRYWTRLRREAVIRTTDETD
ncbi:hypothetical protein D4A92_00245 [Rhizobium rosettiformans]|uniref:Helix-turn-helix domain-containing protein n=1 Tax=Rhizobium rosettiformans TaxID=1368430 RepID=A0ABX7ERN8_9HYPH|nr:hypothetical protein [Rhizobium rosettiformans]QRF49982.1 hypothetical protein D4A92_00245 [Rhizobium rosettiformans]